MTREEFTSGWLLLTIQPWARKYAGQDHAAKLQFEFYWNRLERYQGESWTVACQIFASGEKWPSVDEIRTCLNNSIPPRLQLTYEGGLCEKPEILVKIDLYRNHHNCTTLEAAEKVLPEFAKEHPEPDADDQIQRCEQLIRNLKAHRAHLQVLKQERMAKRP